MISLGGVLMAVLAVAFAVCAFLWGYARGSADTAHDIFTASEKRARRTNR